MLSLTLYGKGVRLSFGGIVSKYECRAVDGKCKDSPCRKIADGWVDRLDTNRQRSGLVKSYPAGRVGRDVPAFTRA
jgi:hypothetical protein